MSAQVFSKLFPLSPYLAYATESPPGGHFPSKRETFACLGTFAFTLNIHVSLFLTPQVQPSTLHILQGLCMSTIVTKALFTVPVDLPSLSAEFLWSFSYSLDLLLYQDLKFCLGLENKSLFFILIFHETLWEFVESQ